ncbi:MAG TPA: tetratricopeptide repeat protein [Polyangiaceae bacterium LLY-WYZ-14_1]|nr:tetratricopeptide repeat protein [Polyangiaceae bacterium LLY-WYZ-14_1]
MKRGNQALLGGAVPWGTFGGAGLALGLAVVAAGALAGCGGGSDAAPARDAEGNVVTSGGDEEVTERANELWTEARAAFDAAQKEGWNDERCSSVRDGFEEAIEAQGGGFAEAQYMAGLTALRCGKPDKAEEYYARAVELWPEFCKARVALGVLQQESGRAQEARRNFETAREKSPRTCNEAYVSLAHLQRVEGGEENEREALANLRRALAIDANYLPAFNEMALLYLERAKDMGRQGEQMLDLAGLVCRQAQLIDREYAAIYNTWGLIYIQKENVIEALRMFERARSLDDDFFEANMNFGQITLSFRGYEDAKTAFTRAVELRPDSYDAYIGLGAALRGLNQFAEAEAAYEKAKELNAERPESYFNLAVLHQDYLISQQTELPGQIAVLREAVDLYDQFVAKAGSDDDYESSVEDVTHTCRERSNRRRRRRGNTCNPGRKQRAQQTIEALEETVRIQEEMEQQQQQQQEQQQESAGESPAAG